MSTSVDPIVWTDVTDFMSALSSTPASMRALIIEYVNEEALKASVFGGETTARYKMARIYLAAHMAIFMKLSWNQGGIPTSMSGGGLSESFQQSSANSEWASTGPGRLLLALINGSPARGPYVL